MKIRWWEWSFRGPYLALLAVLWAIATGTGWALVYVGSAIEWAGELALDTAEVTERLLAGSKR